MLSHRNLLAATLSYYADVDAVAPGDCILHAAPMTHGSGLYILPHIAAGACNVVPASGAFDPPEIFALLRHWRGVTMFAAPTMVKRLVEHPQAAGADCTNLKTIVYGGGPMYVEDLKLAMARLGNRFVQIYGQGESPMTITVLTRAEHANTAHPRHAARLASVGRAQTVVEVRVVDGDDRPLPPGELGEVLLRGDTVMPGYWDDPEASAAALRGGWLHTGDLRARSRRCCSSTRRCSNARWSAGRTRTGARRRSPSWSRATAPRSTRTNSMRCAWSGSPASSARAPTKSSSPCPRTTTARCSRPNCGRGWSKRPARPRRECSGDLALQIGRPFRAS
jgi:acyl-CoA synthetase (AMP-forming)/AMP-acid ligase II